jgi:tRNA dimethylallyltransferase
VGKTSFALQLARQFNGEIIGADAMQIYRRMDIGTAKPTPVEQAAVPHHMIDIVNPDQDFDAAVYAKMASGIIRGIIARGRTVFVVGGTGLYIKALIYGLFEEGLWDPVVRRRLKQRAESESAAVLHQRLAAVDGVAAERIHPNDTYRILRALEVFEVTGEPLTVFQQRHGFRERRFTTLKIGLFRPRPVLYDRINKRVDLMMGQGFLEEVRQLLACGYGVDIKSMQSLGYRHLAAVIRGDDSLAQAVTTLKRDHRRYAKRQMTWFKADREIVWADPVVSRDVKNRIRDFLSETSGAQK